MLDLYISYKYVVSLLLSVLLGFAIGFERKTRLKEAGVRTHTIVCFGSCLLMVVSKYGFSDGLADTARVAAQIVSGIGFLGAGMIVYRKNSVHGLTTAAGVWATAGVGMACGAELFLLAVISTIIMIGTQCVLHINCKILNPKRSYQIKLSFIQNTNENIRIKEIFKVGHFQKLSVVRGEKTIWTVVVSTDKEIESVKIDQIMKENDFIVSVERCDE